MITKEECKRALDCAVERGKVQPMRNDEPYGILKIYITYKGTEYKSIESFIKAMEETRCQG